MSTPFATPLLIEIWFETQIPESVPATTTDSMTIDLTSPELPVTAPIASVLDVKPLAPLEVKPKEKEVKSKEKEAKPKKNAASTAKTVKEPAAVCNLCSHVSSRLTGMSQGKSNLLGWLNPKAKTAVASSSKTDIIMEDVKAEPTKPTFDEIFLPFRVKKGTTLAPINYFDQDVIILDDIISKRKGKGITRGMSFLCKTCYKTDIHSDTTNLLESFRASLPSSSKPHRTTYARLHASAPPLKTTSVLAVRDLMEQLEDATNAGDVSGTKSLISTLSDRKQLPLRWFHFWDNTRPMWVGTWTKTARNVGPRTPFGKEDGVDYEYDSGEDWQEEEEEGEEMEDTATVDGEDEEEDEDDNRDWIVDDEDEELEQEDEGVVLSLEDVGAGIVVLPSSKGKRKADGFQTWGSKGGNKRRKLVQLKSDCKGPFWESKIGHPQIPAWSRYAIRVLNGNCFFSSIRHTLADHLSLYRHSLADRPSSPLWRPTRLRGTQRSRWIRHSCHTRSSSWLVQTRIFQHLRLAITNGDETRWRVFRSEASDIACR